MHFRVNTDTAWAFPSQVCSCMANNIVLQLGIFKIYYIPLNGINFPKTMNENSFRSFSSELQWRVSSIALLRLEAFST